MAPLVATLAMTLAKKFLPDLIGKITKSEKAENVTKSIVDLAVQTTGIENPEQALRKMEEEGLTNDQVVELRMQVASLLEQEIEDVQHARTHNHHKIVTEKVIYGVMFGNPVFILAIFLGLVYLAVNEGSLAQGLGTTLAAMAGGALNQLYQERQQAMNYLCGSSVGSKLKELLKR